MSDQTYEQPPLFYTKEEVEALVEATKTSLITAHDITVKDRLEIHELGIKDAVYRAMREAISEGFVTKDEAVSVYNLIADKCGWTNVMSFPTHFTVTVEYDGYEIATFHDVEAENEDKAVEEVLENMEVEAEMTITLTYNGDSGYDTVTYDQWNLDDRFSAEAEEQD